MSSGNNSSQNFNMTYNGHEHGSKGNTSTVNLNTADIEKSSLGTGNAQITLDPKASKKPHPIEVTKDLGNQIAVISNNFNEERSRETNKTTALSDVKIEPWEYCVKKEVKEELDNTSTDFSESKVYISEVSHKLYKFLENGSFITIAFCNITFFILFLPV